ncbi:hypothetical protein DOTSEDRAFT_75217 [Dothistroma septosporum NZE10]|uniref:Fatty acid desaturase domain-containing protein n=1 Tax=Dothistroma septosporum (strain NZE10 / CBS 128990) TaxID=675120 RepID=M2YKS6_DOTSN|nr:hypothetical protein DOTSEDRAFT_75217 [Dothistroma septosporum NZE10]
MEPKVNLYFTEPDIVVLNNLIQDVKSDVRGKPLGDTTITPEMMEKYSDDEPVVLEHDKLSITRLEAYNDPNSPDFAPTVFTTWDSKDLPVWVNEYLVKPYARMAMRVVRHPTDVVFLTHIILYMTVNLGSAAWLFYRFTYIHGVLHLAYTGWNIGPFTLMMHNHIHNNGVLAKKWKWFDSVFPYVLEPLLGHTWDSYYYHHVKHHHVESNGPGDLSTTIRYQRDDVLHFLHYFARFLLFIWLELPLYFIRKGKTNLAVRAFIGEASSYVFIYMMTKLNPRASTFVFLLPFAVLRFALMVGNWGQHALVDEVDPSSDFRTSVTMIDVMSNRVCFNDGYHTAHHLNPLRHWRDQPLHFVKSKEAYRSGRALVFHDIDWFMMTVKLLSKDYLTLADHLVPMGDQIGMSRTELADMLRRKTRKFTEADIQAKFRRENI